MFERFTEKAIKVIMLAQEEARRLGHNFVGTEQVLLGLIGEGTGVAAKTLKSMGVNLKDARAEVEKIMRQAYDKTVEILKEHYDKLELVANALLKKEKINGEEFENLMKYGTLEAPKDETAADESENAHDTVTENETDSSVDIPDNSNEENKNE